LTLAEAVARAESADERTLAQLRRDVEDDLEAAARSESYQERAVAFRAIGRLRFNRKTELLARGLDDPSPACRGSALLSLEALSRDHPGLVNSARSRLHTLATSDANGAVRRIAVIALKNGSATPDTLTLLAHLAEDDEDAELRAAAKSTHGALRRKAASR
jgi:HEAT repeat protein